MPFVQARKSDMGEKKIYVPRKKSCVRRRIFYVGRRIFGFASFFFYLKKATAEAMTRKTSKQEKEGE